MERWHFLVLFAALAACGQPDPSPATPTASPAEAPPAAQTIEPSAQVGSLAGAWRVAGLDGRSFDEPVGLSLTGDEQRVWWEPRCAGMERVYRIDGERIAFAAIQPAGPGCEIGLPPRLDEVVRALDEADSISRTSSNGILISGPRHSVLLFSQ